MKTISIPRICVLFFQTWSQINHIRKCVMTVEIVAGGHIITLSKVQCGNIQSAICRATAAIMWCIPR